MQAEASKRGCQIVTISFNGPAQDAARRAEMAASGGSSRGTRKLIALERYPRVFVKISHTWALSKQPYPWLDAQEHVKRLYHSFGPQRLMRATDWPIIEDRSTYDKALRVVRDDLKFFNADDLRWVLSGTIERVWNLPE